MSAGIEGKFMYSISLLSSDGQAVACEVLAATDDADAVMKAGVYLQLHPTIPGGEVWNDRRLVHRFLKPSEPSKPARQSA